jgi:phosphoglycerate dehydrogenase-like enzyme
VIDAGLIAGAPELRLIATMEIFPLSIDFAAATGRGIPVTGLAHSREITETTAEFTFALMSALSWRIPQAMRMLGEGRWVQYQSMVLPADLMRGGTLGIVGLGAVGRGVARRAQANGMRVLYTDRQPLGAGTEQGLDVYWREIEDLFSEADIVVLTLALTRATRNLVDARLLSYLRPHALLVNTSRGDVLDESALADALEGGRLAGAALDVYRHELPDHDPHPDPRLLDLPNVILTPHIGTSARQNRCWMAQQVVANILRHHRGERPRHVLNPEVYGEPPLRLDRIG